MMKKILQWVMNSFILFRWKFQRVQRFLSKLFFQCVGNSITWLYHALVWCNKRTKDLVYSIAIHKLWENTGIRKFLYLTKFVRFWYESQNLEIFYKAMYARSRLLPHGIQFFVKITKFGVSYAYFDEFPTYSYKIQISSTSNMINRAVKLIFCFSEKHLEKHDIVKVIHCLV